MAMEHSLYVEVVKLWRKDLLFFAVHRNKTEAKFKFQGQSARSQLWLDLDLYWIGKNLALANLISIRKYFKIITISKTILCSKHFKFQLEMQIF